MAALLQIHLARFRLDFVGHPIEEQGELCIVSFSRRFATFLDARLYFGNEIKIVHGMTLVPGCDLGHSQNQLRQFNTDNTLYRVLAEIGHSGFQSRPPDVG